jgi:hypothetical protein
MTDYLDPVKDCIVRLLERVKLGDKPLTVLTEYHPKDMMPCLTMQDAGGPGLTYSHIYYRTLQDGTMEKVRAEWFTLSLETHAWSIESGEERDYIIKELLRVVTEAKLGLYMYCTNFDLETNTCNTTKRECDTHSGAVDNIQVWEGRCPYPYITDPEDERYRNPSTWFAKAGIYSETFEPRGAVTMDDLKPSPPVYHKVVGWDFEMYQETVLSTAPFKEIGDTDSEIME